MVIPQHGPNTFARKVSLSWLNVALEGWFAEGVAAVLRPAPLIGGPEDQGKARLA